MEKTSQILGPCTDGPRPHDTGGQKTSGVTGSEAHHKETNDVIFRPDQLLQSVDPELCTEVSEPLQQLKHAEPLEMRSPLTWTPVAEDAFCELKRVLVASTTLTLPNYSKPFVQMVDNKGPFMTSVLTQKHGERCKPVAYYSGKLDSVAQALPPCLRAVVAAAEVLQSSATTVLYHHITLMVPHAVSMLLLETKMAILSQARHLSCINILLSQPNVLLKRCTTLNPATLMPTEEDGTPHNCRELAEQVVKTRHDLLDTPLSGGEVVFVDGSSKKDMLGKTQTGYAVVTSDRILQAKSLPSSFSAQAAELVALTEACKLMKGKRATIYTDSQYAYATCHVFATYWEKRGMRTSTGKPVTHAQLLKDLIAAVQLPKQLAICKCAAHTKGQDAVTKGNAFADETAKKAGQKQCEVLVSDVKDVSKDLVKEMQQQSPTAEIEFWKRKGAVMTEGLYM